jgi:Domain of unknown function (DUF4124)/Uncharacterized protein conserved in bacteria (DUF2059)
MVRARNAVAVVVALGLLLTASKTAAEGYRWVDANGNVVYSDTPPPPDEANRPPAPSAPAADSSVERLLDVTGLKHQARLVAAQTRETLRGSFGNLDDERRRRVDAITDRDFHPDAFYGVLRSEFGRHFNEPWLNDVIAWYASPVGRRIAAAEVRFYAIDRRREVEDFVAGLVNNRPSAVRVALLQRLDAASGSTEGSLDLFVAINRSIIRVVEPLIPAASRVGAGQRESQARQIRLQMQEALKQVNVVTMLLLYQGLTDDELRSYIEFLETDAGAWYSGAARQAIVAAVTSTVERTASELVRVVPPEQWFGAGVMKPTIPSEKLKL